MSRFLLRIEGKQRVRASDGRVRPEALQCFHYAEVPGLSIVWWPPIEGDPWPRYTITHKASGARVGPHTYTTLEEAEDALARVAGLFDWSLAGFALREAFDARALQDRAFIERVTFALNPIQRSESAA